jgi:hypothetical protein
MSLLIGVSGKAGAGKDTVGKLLQYHKLKGESPEGAEPTSFEKFQSNHWGSGLQIKKFSEKLKVFVASVLNIPREALENEEFKRSNLEKQWNMFHEVYKGFKPFEVCVDTVERPMTVRELLIRVGDGLRRVAHPNFWVNAELATFTNRCEWVFTDVRYHNEKSAIEDRGGYVIRIDRPGIVEIDSDTERFLDDAGFDYRIFNNGNLDILSTQVKEIYDNIKARTGTVASNK